MKNININLNHIKFDKNKTMLIIDNIKLNDLESDDVKYAHVNACFDATFVANIKHTIIKNSTISPKPKYSRPI